MNRVTGLHCFAFSPNTQLPYAYSLKIADESGLESGQLTAKPVCFPYNCISVHIKGYFINLFNYYKITTSRGVRSLDKCSISLVHLHYKLSAISILLAVVIKNLKYFFAFYFMAIGTPSHISHNTSLERSRCSRMGFFWLSTQSRKTAMSKRHRIIAIPTEKSLKLFRTECKSLDYSFIYTIKVCLGNFLTDTIYSKQLCTFFSVNCKIQQTDYELVRKHENTPLSNSALRFYCIAYSITIRDALALSCGAP